MKLATIEKILDLSPIPGADKIQLAQVLGYQTVVKIGEFKVGDYCVWHNPDTVVDADNPDYSFLAKNNFRLKTAKFKGNFSQGLALPLQMLTRYGEGIPYGADENGVLVIPPSIIVNNERIVLEEGTDVSEIIKIKKYEKSMPACLAGIAAGAFPTDIVPKTDEPLLRSNPKVVREFAGKLCRGTLKLDGSSGTFIFHDNEFMVCSRNLKLKPDDTNSFWKIAVKYDLETKLKALNIPMAIQGEVVGPGIQGNPLGLTEIDYYVFNIMFPNSERKYANPDVVAATAQMLGLKTVPTVWEDIFPAENAIAFFQEFVNTLIYPNNKPAEGLVIRPLEETVSEALKGRLSVKIINENYKD